MNEEDTLDIEIGGDIWWMEGFPNAPPLPTLFRYKGGDGVIVVVCGMDYSIIDREFIQEECSIPLTIDKTFIDPDDYVYDEMRFEKSADIWVAKHWDWIGGNYVSCG